MVSDDSSGHEHALELAEPALALVHITRPGFNRRLDGVRREAPPRAVRGRAGGRGDGPPALDMARTAVDIAREHGSPYGEIACDSAIRRGVSPLAWRSPRAHALLAGRHGGPARRSTSPVREPAARSRLSARLLVNGARAWAPSTPVPGPPDGRPDGLGRHRRRMPRLRDPRQGASTCRWRMAAWRTVRPRPRCCGRRRSASADCIRRPSAPRRSSSLTTGPPRAVMKRMREEYDDTVRPVRHAPSRTSPASPVELRVTASRRRGA